jgi:ubiquitin-protein ligase
MTTLKRLSVELLEDLIPEYKSIAVVYDETKTTFTLKNITIILNSDYPFRPPTVLVNNNPYHKFILPPCSTRISQLVHEETQTCLCCHSIIKNPSLWSVAHRIKHIMSEINSVSKLKMKIKYIMAIEDICKQFESRLNQNVDKHIEKRIMEFL